MTTVYSMQDQYLFWRASVQPSDLGVFVLRQSRICPVSSNSWPSDQLQCPPGGEKNETDLLTEYPPWRGIYK